MTSFRRMNFMDSPNKVDNFASFKKCKVSTMSFQSDFGILSIVINNKWKTLRTA